MKEFEFTFARGLKVGLRRHHKNPRNEEALIEAFNVRIGEFGTESYSPMKEYPNEIVHLWPFPQIIRDNRMRYIIILDETRATYFLYDISDLSSDNTVPLLQIPIFQTDNPHGFELANFDNFVFFTNGTIGYVAPLDTAALNSEHGIPNCRHCVAFNGQLLIGNVTDGTLGLDESGIAWSEIGTYNFKPVLTSVDDANLRIDRVTTAGFAKVPGGGTVHRLVKLGEQVIVFTSNRIVGMRPVVEPLATFGFTEMATVGINGPGCVCATQGELVFIDNYGWIWRLLSTGELRKLGYKEFMNNLNLSRVVITYDELNRDYYISDGQRCYLLTQWGLSEVYQCPSTIFVNEMEYDTYCINHGGNDQQAFVLTDIIDFGFRPMKHISSVSFGVAGDGEMDYEALVMNRFDVNEEFHNIDKSDKIDVNAEGVAFVDIGGSDFKFGLSARDLRDFNLDYFKVRWKLIDQRSIRGSYGMPISGGGDG